MDDIKAETAGNNSFKGGRRAIPQRAPVFVRQSRLSGELPHVKKEEEEEGEEKKKKEEEKKKKVVDEKNYNTDVSAAGEIIFFVLVFFSFLFLQISMEITQ